MGPHVEDVGREDITVDERKESNERREISEFALDGQRQPLPMLEKQLIEITHFT